MMLGIMKENLLGLTIDNFHSAMERSEREIDHLKSDVYRRIAAGEHTEEYFLEQYRVKGFRVEILDEVFREMLRRERARNKAIQMNVLKNYPDLQDRFEQLTV
jgi:hypothetical protein